MAISVRGEALAARVLVIERRDHPRVPFEPLRLLLLFDDAHGFCGRVVPRMRSLLEQRAFLVDLREVKSGSVGDLDPYAGIVIGSPVLGVRGRPTEAIARYLRDLPSLGERAVALFCVYFVRAGSTLDQMRALVAGKDGRVIAEQRYAVARPQHGDHVLPTECMVRIRRQTP
jgi:hypothetical protein